MTGEIIAETPLSMADLKEELESIKKRDKELNFRAAKTEEYLKQFVALSISKKNELADKINKLKIPRLREQHISKIIDLMPKKTDSLKVILQGYTLTISNENLKSIVEVINKVAENK